jgi:hypothetical protein
MTGGFVVFIGLSKKISRQATTASFHVYSICSLLIILLPGGVKSDLLKTSLNKPQIITIIIIVLIT